MTPKNKGCRFLSRPFHASSANGPGDEVTKVALNVVVTSSKDFFCVILACIITIITFIYRPFVADLIQFNPPNKHTLKFLAFSVGWYNSMNIVYNGH